MHHVRLQGALECLLAAAGGPLEAAQTAAEAPKHPYSLTCAAVVRDEASLQLLLGMLELDGGAGADFYVRYASVQLLSRLVSAHPAVMQDAVLAWPQVRLHAHCY
jgi:hypothetical protein